MDPTAASDSRLPGTPGASPDGANLTRVRDDEGRRVASGTYFCRLSAGSRAATEKVTLLP